MHDDYGEYFGTIGPPPIDDTKCLFCCGEVGDPIIYSTYTPKAPELMTRAEKKACKLLHPPKPMPICANCVEPFLDKLKTLPSYKKGT
jgi:hypothetical protein